MTEEPTTLIEGPTMLAQHEQSAMRLALALSAYAMGSDDPDESRAALMLGTEIAIRLTSHVRAHGSQSCTPEA